MSNTIFCISRILTSFFYAFFKPLRTASFKTLEKLTEPTEDSESITDPQASGFVNYLTSMFRTIAFVF